MNKEKIKTKIPFAYRAFLYLRKIFRRVKGIFLAWKWRERTKRLGKLNPDKHIYIIRTAFDGGIGLMGLTMHVMSYIYENDDGKTEFVVDYKNYRTDYHEAKIRGKDINIWENYFVQPNSISLEEAYHSHNVTLSGRPYPHVKELPLFFSCITGWDEDLTLKGISAIWKRYIRLNGKTTQYINEEYSGIISSGNKKAKILGVLWRGSEFVAMKPKNHAIQPTEEQIIEKARDCIEKWDCDKIFLVTEDADYVDAFKNNFRDMVIINKQTRFKKENGIDFSKTVSSQVNRGKSKYQEGLEYLSAIVILSRCDCLLAGRCTGSLAALMMNGCKYEEQYIFDLGQYE